jgi:tRNA nucleotidyltransferase (CCA-adding enzyme)
LTQEQQLRDKLRRIEALHAGATTPGERDAAAAAMERLRAKLHESEKTQKPVEFRFLMRDAWARKLFIALCRRYGLEPYRKRGQRYTTVNLKAPKSFVDGVLWPHYQAIQYALREYLDAATERVIREYVYKDAGEAAER